MAKLIICSVYDSKVQAFQTPFVQRTPGEALRGFTDAVNNPETGSLTAHPEDFSLMELGTFDEFTGLIEPLNVPHSLGLAVQYKKAPQPTPLEAAIAASRQ